MHLFPIISYDTARTLTFSPLPPPPPPPSAVRTSRFTFVYTSRLLIRNHPTALCHRRAYRLGCRVPRSQPRHPSRDHPCSHHAGGPARASRGEIKRETRFQGLFAVRPQHKGRRHWWCWWRWCCSYSGFRCRHDRGGEDSASATNTFYVMYLVQFSSTTPQPSPLYGTSTAVTVLCRGLPVLLAVY